jgi:hypothetical protein
MTFCPSQRNDTIFQNDGALSDEADEDERHREGQTAPDGIGQQEGISTAIAA